MDKRLFLQSIAYRVRRSWVLHLAVSVHFMWGFLVLANGDLVTGITAISTTRHLFQSPLLTAIMYIAVSCLSWSAMQLSDRVPRLISLTLLLPQQFLLMLSAFGGILAIYHSSFADGVLRPRAFLAADQGVAILVAVFHTLALWEIFTEGVFQKIWTKAHGSLSAAPRSRWQR